MESILLFLALCLMSSEVYCESQSMSCSTVNGKTICNKQTSQGNTALSQSGASIGGGSIWQQTYAGAGGPGQWDSSSQRVVDRPGGGGYHPSSDVFDYSDPSSSGASAGRPPSDGSFGYSSSSSSSTGSFPGFGFVQTGTFAGPNYPAQGGSGSQVPNYSPPLPNNPFAFVSGFMNGFGGGGAFAGPGGAFAGAGAGAFAFPFGRR